MKLAMALKTYSVCHVLYPKICLKKFPTKVGLPVPIEARLAQLSTKRGNSVQCGRLTVVIHIFEIGKRTHVEFFFPAVEMCFLLPNAHQWLFKVQQKKYIARTTTFLDNLHQG